jgi:streptogramin lyase
LQCFFNDRSFHLEWLLPAKAAALALRIDYRTNMDANRSSSRSAPADLPGAVYDRQGGLWFTNNGYYVVLSHSHQLSEQAARIIVGKL